ncbi:transposase (fragment) [Xenorhabdus nematophila str. Anatoliense]
MRYRLDKKGKKESLDYHYYISSAALEADRFKAAVRGHW